jgi:hypothetical protein
VISCTSVNKHEWGCCAQTGATQFAALLNTSARIQKALYDYF